ncbi:MAG: hypothetical protein BAJALOKI1v1_210035 [Promethearchaeota archaeon]|nr:MAG: hypothetical protein BAJALOKI1v1_210035 [Candidatus Lokiarchaeota archaeon]
MTKKKFLSRKKTVQQSLSIPFPLKSEIIKFIKENREKNPDDKRFRSVSAFYTHVMHKAMEIFEKGKTLKTFKAFADEEILKFYESFSFSAIKSLFEMITEVNRYTKFNYQRTLGFYTKTRQFILDNLERHELNTYETFLQRIETYFLSNGIVKELTIKPLLDESMEYPVIQIEAVSEYENISFENAKFFAGICALLGIEVIDFEYSRGKPSSFRLQVVLTALFFKVNYLKPQIYHLYNINMAHLINYDAILRDEEYYLWMRMAEDKSVYLDFHSTSTKKQWLNRIESDIKKTTSGEEFFKNKIKLKEILKYLESIHWISLINEDDLLFKFSLPKHTHETQKDFILQYLSHYSHIKKMDNKYLLTA